MQINKNPVEKYQRGKFVEFITSECGE